MAIDNELLKNRVKSPIKFAFFVDNALWYQTQDGWQFPVPVEDTAGATFNAEEKGTLMRWVRKHMQVEVSRREEIERLKQENAGDSTSV